MKKVFTITGLCTSAMFIVIILAKQAAKINYLSDVIEFVMSKSLFGNVSSKRVTMSIGFV